MKKAATLAAALVAVICAYAQKKPLDHSVYDSWQSISGTVISPSGNTVAYAVNPQEGDGILTIRTFGKKGRQIDIPRGKSVTIMEDDAHALCLIKPEFQKTRAARIKKKKGSDLPQDSLAIVDLRTGDIVKFPCVQSYKAGLHAVDAVVFATSDTTFVPEDERKKKDIGSPLAVYHFADGAIDTLRHIDEYTISDDGKYISLVQKTDADNSIVGFFDIAQRSSKMLADTTAWHAVPEFDLSGTRALYLEATDTLDSGSKHPSLMLFDIAAGESRRLIGPGDYAGLPAGWGITENSDYYFSHDGKRIFAGVQAFTEPDDTTLVSFETPGLDIWNWDGALLPPMYKADSKRYDEATVPALFSGGRLCPASADILDRVIDTRWDLTDIMLDVHRPNPVEWQWDQQAVLEVSAVQLENGKRSTLVSGKVDNIQLSPDGIYALWWDYGARCWMRAATDGSAAADISSAAGVNFWREDDDHPQMPDNYGIGGWMEDGSVLAYDYYDIWKLSPSSAERLTRGREEGVTYRIIRTRSRNEYDAYPASATLYLSVFDNATKEKGLASVGLAKPSKSFKTLMKGGFTVSGLQKAENGTALIYTKGNFRDPMDLYYVPAPGKKEVKLSAINPQISDYNWGTVELYKWTAYDGKQLEGLLYKPEDFDSLRKYPVMIYFYEKNSENLYTHYTVAPSRSIINIPFYVSRGYVVFVPDIVYTPGLPGESAYNCIVSGAESLKRFPWIDGDNMAIQGQSWGGYQVAYLITRTDMFKAAGAGAPVSNMTSAYGGIRWESGMSRQFQYEQSQSRIGRDLWNGIELYMESSALFKLPNVNTPVLIMHNDNDGAVPWYQGIEMFMGLRRLGKPAWLLEYNGEAHNLRERRNTKDLSIRLQQFFDHYLKGEPAPAWMVDGVPTARKSQYFGYETAK